MKVSLKNILIAILVVVILCLGLKIYYTWKQYKDMSIGEIVVDIFDKTEDEIITDNFGNSVFSALQNTDVNFATDKQKAAEFMQKYNVVLTAEENSLYTACSTQKLKSERIYQDIMGGAGSSKSWILYGDGNLYYVCEVVNGMWDMGPLSAIVAARYMMDNSEDKTIKKAYRFQTYPNGWEAFWGTGRIFGSEYFTKL